MSSQAQAPELPATAAGRQRSVHGSRDKGEDVPADAPGGGGRKRLAAHAFGAASHSWAQAAWLARRWAAAAAAVVTAWVSSR